MTWIETGLVTDTDRDGKVDPYILCIWCFHEHRTVMPRMRRFWLLNADGTPQRTRLRRWMEENLPEEDGLLSMDIMEAPMHELAGRRRTNRGHGRRNVVRDTADIDAT